MVVGVVMACATIGLRWSQIQWLATALTFGLAFGLQEIFANFVAGLIILFERPIRVGDVVTVADVTGVVSRMRICATTITDWDRRELIVPNKEFITGRLLNWTLSDKVNRIEIEVGIAYGSDTERCAASPAEDREGTASHSGQSGANRDSGWFWRSRIAAGASCLPGNPRQPAERPARTVHRHPSTVLSGAYRDRISPTRLEGAIDGSRFVGLRSPRPAASSPRIARDFQGGVNSVGVIPRSTTKPRVRRIEPGTEPIDAQGASFSCAGPPWGAFAGNAQITLAQPVNRCHSIGGAAQLQDGRDRQTLFTVVKVGAVATDANGGVQSRFVCFNNAMESSAAVISTTPMLSVGCGCPGRWHAPWPASPLRNSFRDPNRIDELCLRQQDRETAGCVVTQDVPFPDTFRQELRRPASGHFRWPMTKLVPQIVAVFHIDHHHGEPRRTQLPLGCQVSSLETERRSRQQAEYRIGLCFVWQIVVAFRVGGPGGNRRADIHLL